jgi:hypothetical protein
MLVIVCNGSLPGGRENRVVVSTTFYAGSIDRFWLEAEAPG